MKNIIAALIVIIGIVLVIPVFLAYSVFSWGYVVSILWNWFINPLNLGLPTFTIAQFIGIMLVLSALLPKKSTPTSIKKEYKDDTYDWVNPIFAPWITLLFAYLVHTFLI